jgi:hypothetical protein
MMLPIAIIVVLVLLAVAVLPSKPREQREPAVGLFQSSVPATSVSLREQQLREESDAIATEYRRRADEVWLGEVREKAALLLGSK